MVRCAYESVRHGLADPQDAYAGHDDGENKGCHREAPLGIPLEFQEPRKLRRHDFPFVDDAVAGIKYVLGLLDIGGRQ